MIPNRRVKACSNRSLKTELQLLRNRGGVGELKCDRTLAGREITCKLQRFPEGEKYFKKSGENDALAEICAYTKKGALAPFS